MAGYKARTIKGLFVLSAAISCLTCFNRADYNLPLMVFALFNWVPGDTILEGEVNHSPFFTFLKTSFKKKGNDRLKWLLIYAAIVDAVWISLWGYFW